MLNISIVCNLECLYSGCEWRENLYWDRDSILCTPDLNKDTAIYNYWSFNILYIPDKLNVLVLFNK